MKIWGEALIEEVICWFLASAKYLKVWRPLREPIEKDVEVPLLGRITVALNWELGGKRLSRGPTFLTRRSDF
jgi:hypothetical protein